jgi:hypothetical protein
MKKSLDGLFDLRKEETGVKIGTGTGLTSTTVGTLRATVEQADRIKIDVTLKNYEYGIHIATASINQQPINTNI